MKSLKLSFFILGGLTICLSYGKTTSRHIEKNGLHLVEQHPGLILTKEGVDKARNQQGKIPLFDQSLKNAKKILDAEIESGIDVPVPKDFSGGYTHERHKKNFLALQKAGVLYQLLQEDRYAVYARDMFMEYARLYPTLPVHPQTRSYARGKLFWQCLNDANWLVYTSQAYDCIYNFLTPKERKHLETNLFRPLADFISKQNPQFFNRIHNHSTWGTVAVGMIALVMNDDELLETALYGLKDDNIDSSLKDNDGGFIKTKDQKAGFLANLEEPFSPDGYYTEGPYYQRYAMYPFLIFAQALHNKKPELEIFKYKNSVLLKAVNALLNLSDAKGHYFPINDAQKGMSYHSRESIAAVDIAYHFGNENFDLLSIAQEQNKVVLNDAGLAVAIAIKEGKARKFNKTSLELRDGTNGDEGGVGILRKDPIELLFKYSAQGLSHGHYDKLSFSLYDKGHEVLQDYGLARFVNIEQKGGGNYLKENTSWAKQTIAHNTIVQNETSHFKGQYETGSKHHSEKYFFDSTNDHFQIVSAKEKNAYPGTELHRTMAIIKDSALNYPYILDMIRIVSDKENQYDLPFYYLGQILQTNFEYTTPKSLEPLGNANGYQHLYKIGSGISNKENIQFTWLLNNTFYTLSTLTSTHDELIFARLGANDPNFNLRNDPAFILRKNPTKNTVFVSIIEPHGTYSPVTEFSVNAYGTIKNQRIAYNNEHYLAVEITDKSDRKKIIIQANQDNSKDTEHQLNIENKNYIWKGPFTLKQVK